MTIVDMTSESVGILSSPDRSSSPSLPDQIIHDSYPTITTPQISTECTGVVSQALRSPVKRQLTIEDSLVTTNDPKRVCNR